MLLSQYSVSKPYTDEEVINIMARGKKRGVDDLIHAIDQKISKAEETLSDMKAERARLQEQKNNELALVLVKAAAEKGLSLEEAIAKIKE